jgi:hypothetical protein
LEANFEWERRIEFTFDCYEYSDTKKVKLTILGFTNYTLVWWEQNMTHRRRMGENIVTTWELLKILMTYRFYPSIIIMSFIKDFKCSNKGEKCGGLPQIVGGYYDEGKYC